MRHARLFASQSYIEKTLDCLAVLNKRRLVLRKAARDKHQNKAQKQAKKKKTSRKILAKLLQRMLSDVFAFHTHIYAPASTQNLRGVH